MTDDLMFGQSPIVYLLLGALGMLALSFVCGLISVWLMRRRRPRRLRLVLIASAHPRAGPTLELERAPRGHG